MPRDGQRCDVLLGPAQTVEALRRYTPDSTRGKLRGNEDAAQGHLLGARAMRRTMIVLLLFSCSTATADSVPLIREHGTYLVPVLINDTISLNFMVDSGASDVSIPADVFSTLIRAGTISQRDMLDTQKYSLADGSTQSSRRFRIKSLRLGSTELHDVTGSVSPAAGSLLLGQSFLYKMKSWSIDNEHHLLVFNEDPGPVARAHTKIRSLDEPQQSASMSGADSSLLRAVAFALTGDDNAHVSDWPDCVFQVKVGSPVVVLTFHLNNIDPERIRISKNESTSTTDVHIFGEGVVVDAYIGRDPKAPANVPDVLTHHSHWSVMAQTEESDRLLRAWQYIYAHGCRGQNSSF
jgi:clan AA aspartic protease (TIGR02281 family)